MIEIEEMRRLLAYDPATGLITWIVNRGKARAGAEAGCINDKGYRQIGLNGKRYIAHRIAYAMHHGAWPNEFIDHIDGCRTNNRIGNLRDVSNSTNQQNLKSSCSDNRSGSSVPGVCFNKAYCKFEVQAKLDGKRVFLGRFASISEAEAASLAYRRANYAGNTL